MTQFRTMLRRPFPGRRILCATLVLMLAAGAPGQVRALDDLTFDVPGASAALRSDLETGSLLRALRSDGRSQPLDVIGAARAEYGRLIGLLYEHGHYAPRISIRVDGREADSISSLTMPRQIGRVDVRIEPGPVFTFGRADITPRAPGAQPIPGFAGGAVAGSATVRTALAQALDEWRAEGHALAAVRDQRVTADHPNTRLDVALAIAPGPRLNFGTLTPRSGSGDPLATRTERIRAIAGLQPGTTYSPDAIARAESRLRRTGAFASVAVRTAPVANADGSIDMDALIDEAPPRRLGFGAELDTEAGLRLTGFWLHRNLLGGAERLRLEAAIERIGARNGTGLGFTLDARYTRPATLDADTDLELGLRLVRLDERDFAAEAVTAEALLARRFSDTLTGRAGVRLRHEFARFGPGRTLTGEFGTVALPVSLSHDTRDQPLDATTGRYLMAEAMPYLGYSNAGSGVRLRLDARGYADFGSGGQFVLAGRAQAGVILGSTLAATPREYLFYSGGGGTVRGMPFQSLGVTSGGVASGGQGFAALSTEGRIRVSDSLSVVGFAEAGLVSEGAFDGASDWHAGGGVGLRYVTPIGPLRLDIATPLRRNASAAGAQSVQIYLGIGQAF